MSGLWRWLRYYSRYDPRVRLAEGGVALAVAVYSSIQWLVEGGWYGPVSVPWWAIAVYAVATGVGIRAKKRWAYRLSGLPYPEQHMVP